VILKSVKLQKRLMKNTHFHHRKSLSATTQIDKSFSTLGQYTVKNGIYYMNYTVKMNMLYLIKKIVATDYKKYY